MRTAMIWGANGGMGRAVVSHLVTNKWTVVAITHQATDLDNLTPHVIDANVADPFEVQLAVNNASQLVSKVNLWLYAAGDITFRKVADTPFDDWQRILNANLTGAYLTTHHSLPLLATDAHLMYLGERARFVLIDQRRGADLFGLSVFSFSQIEAKVVLARILQNFTLELVDEKVSPHMGATLEPRPGVMMRIHQR